MTLNRLDDLFGIECQVVVVTGAGGVLAGAIARGLADNGARVVILGHTPAKVEKAAEAIRESGGEAIALAADVLEKATLEAALEQVLAAYGRVDALINGAGGNKAGATATTERNFFDLPEDALRAVFDLNLMGTMLPTQVFGKQMAAQGAGSIINIASVTAFKPLTNVVAYGAAKAAVRNFTEWLAVHISQNVSDAIRVNAIAPGFYLTKQNHYLLVDEETGEPTPRGQQIIDHTPMARYGLPEDLVSTAIWLLSPGASFVHGTTVLVDGGYCAFGGV